MSEYYYREAQRLGLKEVRACEARGESTALPALDALLPDAASRKTADLGEVEIPMELIVGVRSAGRVNSFAPNFMPILEPTSEFAVKWQRLCTAHLEEGIREPIRAVEYKNRFYVEEGNKRVSVLRFFGAARVTGTVVRILPDRTPENAAYFAFTEFYKRSGVNFIEFSHAEGYASLQRLLGKSPEEPWTEEERRRFGTVCHYFRQAYEALGGGRLPSTVGDAMLAYMKIGGYPSLCGRSAQEIRAALSHVWEEITLQAEPEPVEVRLHPSEKKPGLITRVLSGGEPKRTRVAFIHDGDPRSSAWTRGHERGREFVQRVLYDKIDTRAIFHALSDDPEATLRRAIEEGSNVIFTTTPRLLPASLRAAVEHPEVTIFNCSLNTPHRYIRTYYARMYEVKFIIGAIAGALAENEPVGYLADYPIFGQIAGVNAFALGAQMVNPRVRVLLEWSAVGGGEAALERLRQRGVRLVSSQDLVRVGKEGSSSLGLTRLDGEQKVNLATPLWQWGTYYEQILRRVRDKSVQQEYAESRRALNYYWGLSAGVVELRCSDKLPASVRKLAEYLLQGVRSGACEPFRAPLFGQNGPVLEGDRSLTPTQIICMDWLAENVEGRIPAYEELTDLGRATVDLMGVRRPV